MNKKVLIILLAVMLAGYAGYCALAQYGFSQGQAAFEAQDWQTAWGHFERAGGFYKFSLPSHTAEALILKDQSGLLLFGKNMRDKGDYGSAIDAYRSFIVLYPETASQLQMAELAGTTYAEWIAATGKDGKKEM
jgi:tetratricopeptide (TPR) repeat protein